jgi:hypothetical protein
MLHEFNAHVGNVVGLIARAVDAVYVDAMVEPGGNQRFMIDAGDAVFPAVDPAVPTSVAVMRS